MKLNKVILTSAAVITLGAAFSFAADTTVNSTPVTGATTSTYYATGTDAYNALTNNTQDNAAVDGEILAGDTNMQFTQSTTLVGNDDASSANRTDKVMIASEVPVAPFVTSLYYASTDVTATGSDGAEANYIYDASWNAENEFITDSFTVAVTGSAGNQTTGDNANQIKIDVTATPFTQVDGMNVKAGAVAILPILGNGENISDSSNAAPASTTNASLASYSSSLTSGYFYTGFAATHDTSATDDGKLDGNILRFQIKNVGGTSNLPSARYVSTVTLNYTAV